MRRKKINIAIIGLALGLIIPFIKSSFTICMRYARDMWKILIKLEINWSEKKKKIKRFR